VVEIYGPESSGKTTLTLQVIAECQKKGGTAAFIDAEHALDPEYARKLGVDLDELRSLAEGESFLLVSAWDSALPSPVVASAWGRQLKVDSVSDPRLAEFVRAFQVGPDTPEPGAPCTGGVGQPG